MIEGLNAWFSTHVEQYENGDVEALSRALAPYADKAMLCALLESVLQDEDWLGETAERSYRHHNGFVKIALISTGSYQLRLHIWWRHDAEAVPSENIHNHRWDFASVLLIGAYRDQEFVQAPTGQPFHVRAE